MTRLAWYPLRLVVFATDGAVLVVEPLRVPRLLG